MSILESIMVKYWHFLWHPMHLGCSYVAARLLNHAFDNMYRDEHRLIPRRKFYFLLFPIERIQIKRAIVLVLLVIVAAVGENWSARHDFLNGGNGYGSLGSHLAERALVHLGFLGSMFAWVGILVTKTQNTAIATVFSYVIAIQIVLIGFVVGEVTMLDNVAVILLVQFLSVCYAANLLRKKIL